MRFSVAAAAFLATAVSAQSTVYQTEEVTITSCAATVTDCPARSTVTSLTSYPVVATTSSAPVYPTYTPESSSSAPVYPTYANSSSAAVPTYPAGTAPVPVYSTKTSAGVPTYPASSVPASSPVLSTLTISTCVPTIIYSIVTVTPSAPATYSPAPSATGVLSYSHNVT